MGRKTTEFTGLPLRLIIHGISRLWMMTLLELSCPSFSHKDRCWVENWRQIYVFWFPFLTNAKFFMFFSHWFWKRLSIVKESNASSAKRLPCKALEGSTEGLARAHIKEISHLKPLEYFSFRKREWFYLNQTQVICIDRGHCGNLTLTFLSVFGKWACYMLLLLQPAALTLRRVRIFCPYSLWILN